MSINKPDLDGVAYVRAVAAVERLSLARWWRQRRDELWAAEGLVRPPFERLALEAAAKDYVDRTREAARVIGDANARLMAMFADPRQADQDTYS